MLKFVVYNVNLKWVLMIKWRYAWWALSLSVFRSSSIMCGCTCSSVISSQLYLHLSSKALWCLNEMTRSVRCDNSSASQWLYICSCRCLLLGVGCCCRALGCSLLGCCRGNSWLFCSSRRCLLRRCSLISFWGIGSGDRLSSHLNLGMPVTLDSIWVTFMNVFSCLSVLSSTNNFDDVGAMIRYMYYSGWEPQCPVIVDYRNILSCIQWGFPAATCIVMVSYTLIFHIQLLHGSPCAWSFVAWLYIEHVDIASQHVIVDENQLGYSCMLVKQDMYPVQSTWHE